MGSNCSACESEAPNEVSLSQTPNPKDDLLQNAASNNATAPKQKNKARSGLDDSGEEDNKDAAQNDNKEDSKYFHIPNYEYDTYTPEEYEELKREKRDPYTFSNGTVYHGDWKGNLRDGYGIQLWPDGARYEGKWEKHKANGQGKFIHVNGDVFEGTWKDDKANGFGVYSHNNGCRYEGNWKDDLQDGLGKESWPDGSYYEGNYVKGKKNGQGIYYWADKSTYNGNWTDNKIDGKGKYTWNDGRIYDGEWLQNKMHGKGTYSWKDGRKYEGEYVNDKKHGNGVYTWADGRKYDGQWAYGKQHGRGKYVTDNGSSKFGIWENGKRIKWLEEGEEYIPPQPMVNSNDPKHVQKVDEKALNHQQSLIKDEVGAIQQPKEVQNEPNPLSKDKVDTTNYMSNVPVKQNKPNFTPAEGGFQTDNAQADNASPVKQTNKVQSGNYEGLAQYQSDSQKNSSQKTPEKGIGSDPIGTANQGDQLPQKIVKEQVQESDGAKKDTEGNQSQIQQTEGINDQFNPKNIPKANGEGLTQEPKTVIQANDVGKTLTEQNKPTQLVSQNGEKPPGDKLSTESVGGQGPVQETVKVAEKEQTAGEKVGENGISISNGEQKSA